MTDAKQPRSAKPGALLSQWWTLGAIATDSRTSGRHTAVAWVIIDRFMQAKGNGRASIRYLEKATGLSQHTIIKACRELVAWGYFTQHLGGGTRPTEYTPKWLVLHPSTALASAEPLYSTVLNPCTALDAASAAPMCSESYLPTPADKPAVQEVEDCSDGAATPPLAGGLAATAAETPAGGFEAFWNSYAHKQQRAKAKAAWAKLDPDTELAATIVTEAGRWFEHYAKHNVEPRWRVLPHNWLAGENWLQDLPIIHTDPKGAAIAKVRGSAKPAKDKPASHGLSLNIRRYRITDHQTEGSPFADFFEIFTFEGEDGTRFTERMHVLKSGTENADDAPDYYKAKELAKAGFGRGNPIGEWIGRVIGINGDADGIAFHYLPEENVELDARDDAQRPLESLDNAASPPRGRPMTLDEINAAAKADFDAWFEAQLEEDAA